MNDVLDRPDTTETVTLPDRLLALKAQARERLEREQERKKSLDAQKRQDRTNAFRQALRKHVHPDLLSLLPPSELTLVNETLLYSEEQNRHVATVSVEFRLPQHHAIHAVFEERGDGVWVPAGSGDANLTERPMRYEVGDEAYSDLGEALVAAEWSGERDEDELPF